MNYEYENVTVYDSSDLDDVEPDGLTEEQRRKIAKAILEERMNDEKYHPKF